jgi:hypothetical protein
VATGAYEQRSEPGEREARQEEKRRQERGDQLRSGGDPRGERAAQATSARFAGSASAATCSLVRPKRRSRLR